MKFTHFKHILALPTYGLTCPGFEWWALKKWKMEPGHPVGKQFESLEMLKWTCLCKVEDDYY